MLLTLARHQIYAAPFESLDVYLQRTRLRLIREHGEIDKLVVRGLARIVAADDELAGQVRRRQAVVEGPAVRRTYAVRHSLVEENGGVGETQHSSSVVQLCQCVQCVQWS